MGYRSVLVLLVLAIAVFTTMVPAWAHEIASSEQVNAAETPALPAKKQEEDKQKKVKAEKKRYKTKKDQKGNKEIMKEEQEKKKKQQKKVLGIMPFPAPAPSPAARGPSPGGSAPSPGNNVMATSPAPTSQNPLAFDVRQTPTGVTIEQCFNFLGGFKAQTTTTPSRIIDCPCCQFDQKISDANFAASCGQDVTFPFTTTPFNYCIDCQDIVGCQQCLIPKPGYTGPGTPPCVGAEPGSGIIPLIPTPLVQVSDIDGSGLKPVTFKTCPPVTSNCILSKGGSTFLVTPTGVTKQA